MPDLEELRSHQSYFLKLFASGYCFPSTDSPESFLESQGELYQNYQWHSVAMKYPRCFMFDTPEPTINDQ